MDLERSLVDYLLIYHKDQVIFVNFCPMKEEMSDSSILIGTDGVNSIVADYMGTKREKLLTEHYGLGIIVNQPYPEVISVPLSQPQNLYRGFRDALNEIYYIGVQISKRTYDTLYKEMKGPEGKLNQLSDNMRKMVINAMIYYNMYKKIDYNIDIFIFPIELSYSKQCAKNNYNQKIFLCGDSCFSHHFFTGHGVNSGFRAMKYLIDHLDDQNITEKYTSFVHNDRKSQWDKYESVLIKFEAIDDALKNVSYEWMLDIAEQNDFYVPYMSKEEIGYLLGCQGVPGCY
jgi:2-polyprenyl-6-methoxyphenol hydroxylase-like FAD-dependent oxidoreductase